MPVDPARLAACFDAAADLDDPGQQRLLADLDDPDLRAELARLLAHDRALPPIPAPGDQDMSEGTAIGELVILGKLGTGATSTVYAARDQALGRSVAIKQLRAVHWAPIGAADRQRMRAEARALAGLSHPNVVQLHELREHHGELLLVMEHVHGQPLSTWIASTRTARGARYSPHCYRPAAASQPPTRSA